MKPSFPLLCLFFTIYVSPNEACSDTIPEVNNANVSFDDLKDSYNNGDKLTYICQQGYTGKIIFVCEEQKWVNTRNAKCLRRRCGRPADIPNGFFEIINGSEFVYGTTIEYKCNTGYRTMSLINNRTCLVGGWNNRVPVCEEIACPPPKVKGYLAVEGLGYYDTTLRAGHKLQFTCNSPGARLEGPREITCNENGEWSNSFPRCEEITCELEEVHGGVAVIGQPENSRIVKYGHKLQFYCLQPQMALRGDREVTCTSGGHWSSPYPICEEVICKLEEQRNVEIAKEKPKVGPPYKPGHELEFRCKGSRLTMIGEPRITCSLEGKWSKPYPICAESDSCGPAPSIEFAFLISEQKPYYRSNERIYYSCTEFYTPNYYPSLDCYRGKWTGSFKCLKPCILSIEQMDANNIQQYYGQKKIMYAHHGQNARFKCQDGRHARYMNFYPQCNDGVMHLPICD